MNSVLGWVKGLSIDDFFKGEGVMSEIVYGPQGCGKNPEAGRKIAAHLGLSKVIFDWNPVDGLPSDTLAFTCIPIDGALNFFEVMAEINGL